MSQARKLGVMIHMEIVHEMRPGEKIPTPDQVREAIRAIFTTNGFEVPSIGVTVSEIPSDGD